MIKKKYQQAGLPRRSRMAKAGFTLVELLVALTLFIIVVMAAITSLYAVNNASRKVNAMRGVLDNLNFAMESMSRTIRTGSTLVCGGGGAPNGNAVNCPFPGGTPQSAISLRSTLGREEDIEYRLNTSTNQLEKKIYGVDGTDWMAMTSPEINVQVLSFYVNGATLADVEQPSVMILMQGVATASTGDTTPFTIQTYISQRAFK